MFCCELANTRLTKELMAFFAPAESLPTPATLQSDDTNLTWIPFLDVTSYAHHVFKAFDVNSTGSISFRVPPPFFWSSLVLVIIKLTHNCTISVSGYACLFIHSSPWEFVRKINLVSIDIIICIYIYDKGLFINHESANHTTSKITNDFLFTFYLF